MLSVTLGVLAGGAGSRMGFPKGDIRLGEKTILDYLLDRWNWSGPTILVTAPGMEKPASANRFDREISDPILGIGPLRGILTALESSSNEMVEVTTVDMPGITANQLEWIADEMKRKPDLLGLMISRQILGDKQVEPFPSVYRRAAIPVIQQQLLQQRRSVHGLLNYPGFISIDAPCDWPESTWVNLNTPADLRKFCENL